MNQLQINHDGNEALILSATQHLEALYRQHASPCLALQIARNYRLLLTQDEHPLKKQYWRALSQRWLLSYQCHRGRQSRWVTQEIF
ncbi:MAG: hypothetical protein JJU48_07430 [Methylophaga sp.]|nr:hypothetical protein [Methylophaga sp.]